MGSSYFACFPVLSTPPEGTGKREGKASWNQKKHRFRCLFLRFRCFPPNPYPKIFYYSSQKDGLLWRSRKESQTAIPGLDGRPLRMIGFRGLILLIDRLSICSGANMPRAKQKGLRIRKPVLSRPAIRLLYRRTEASSARIVLRSATSIWKQMGLVKSISKSKISGFSLVFSFGSPF